MRFICYNISLLRILRFYIKIPSHHLSDDEFLTSSRQSRTRETESRSSTRHERHIYYRMFHTSSFPTNDSSEHRSRVITRSKAHLVN